MSAHHVSGCERWMSMYRPGEAAALLGVATATLRRYSVQFSALLSPSASAAVAQGGGALKRSYSDHDIALLKRASALLERGHTFDQVRSQLASSEDSQDTAAPRQLTITQDMSLALVETVSAQRATIAAQQKTIALLEAERERLRAELERQRKTALAAIRTLGERIK